MMILGIDYGFFRFFVNGSFPRLIFDELRDVSQTVLLKHRGSAGRERIFSPPTKPRDGSQRRHSVLGHDVPDSRLAGIRRTLVHEFNFFRVKLKPDLTGLFYRLRIDSPSLESGQFLTLPRLLAEVAAGQVREARYRSLHGHKPARRRRADSAEVLALALAGPVIDLRLDLRFRFRLSGFFGRFCQRFFVGHDLPFWIIRRSSIDSHKMRHGMLSIR